MKRPGVVTFVGIILYIQAAAAAAFGIVAFLERNDADWQSTTGQSSSELASFAAIELVFALVLLLVAAGVMSGARWSRTLVGIVVGFRIVILSGWMIAHHAGGFHAAALAQILIYAFVLWALYGHQESNDYYEAM